MVDGLRDDLAAALAESEGTAPEVEDTPAVEAPETPSDGRARDANGRFVAKEAEDAPAEPAEEPKAEEATAEPEEKEAAPEAPKEPEALPSLTARWSEADKAMFKGLPKPAQDFVTRRYGEMEADHTRKTQAIAEFRKEYEPVDQMFQPFKQQMQAQGWKPATLVKAWADVEQDLMKGNGADVVARIVRDYKLDPAAVAAKLGLASAAPSGAAAAAPTEQQQAPTFDPTVEKLLEAKFGQILTPLQQQLQTLTKEANERQAAVQRAEQQRAEQTVQSFIDAKDKDGTPLHPHYAAVENDLVVLARIERQAGRIPDLQQLYDKAVWANPSTREQLLAAQQAAQAAKAQSEARAKAAAAKKAATSVTGAPGSGQPPKAQKGERSLRDLIEEAAADHEAA